MTIGVKERILILGALPDAQGVGSLRVLKALREDLSFTPEEQASLNIRTEDGVMKWDGEIEKKVDPRNFIAAFRLLVAAGFSTSED